MASGEGRRAGREGHRSGDVRGAGHAVRLFGAARDGALERRGHAELQRALLQDNVRGQHDDGRDAADGRTAGHRRPRSAVPDDARRQAARAQSLARQVPHRARQTQEGTLLQQIGI